MSRKPSRFVPVVGTFRDRGTFAQVAGIDDVIAVSSGQCHSLALREDGTVWGWGSNYLGQLGVGEIRGEYQVRPLPVQVPGVITALAAGDEHTLSIVEPEAAVG